MYVINAMPLVHPPQTKRLYYALGLVVQRVSGRNHEAFLQDDFFIRLGMKNTGIHMPLPVKAPRRARGLVWLKWLNLDAATTFNMPANSSSTIGAAGNIYSNVDDLHICNHALHTGKVLKPASYTVLLHIPKVNKRSKSGPPFKRGGYAGGIITLEYKTGQRILWHSGALVPHGFSNFMAWSPQGRMSFVIPFNHAPYVSQLTEGRLSKVAQSSSAMIISKEWTTF